MTAADSDPIVRLSTAYWDSQVLLTANRMGIFEMLADGPMSLDDVCNALASSLRSTRLLLNACVSLGFLDLTDGRYGNSSSAEIYLVPGKPGFLGNAIRYTDNLYDTWGRLEQAVREDQPQMASEVYLGDDAGITRDFVYGMHDRALGIGSVLVDLVDLAGRRSMLDVGGGPGTFSSLLAQRYPTLTSRVFDLPGIVVHANEIIASLGVADRVVTCPGDFRTTPFPGGNDVVLISGVFHRESESGCRELIENANEALEPGGMLIICDVFTDAGGTSPTFAAVFGLNMLLTAVDGGVHADADVQSWMSDAGLQADPVIDFPGPMPHRVVVGRKS